MRPIVLLLIVLTETGAWAQSSANISTEKQLTDSIADGATNNHLHSQWSMPWGPQ